MTIRLDQKDWLAQLNQALALGATPTWAPRMIIVDAQVGPRQALRSDAPRTAWEASLKTGAGGGLAISPPSEVARDLLSWPEDHLKAGSALALCCRAYDEAASRGEIAGSGAERGKKSFDSAGPLAAGLAFIKASQELLASLEGCVDVPRSSMPLVERLASAASRAGEHAPMSVRCALRDAMGKLPPQAAWMAMSQAPMSFEAKLPAVRSSQDEPGSKAQAQDDAPMPPLMGLPSLGLARLGGARRQNAVGDYVMCKNGSFTSSEFARSETALGLALVLAEPRADREMGMEHSFHQHFLQTPEGRVHGWEKCRAWASEVIAYADALAIEMELGPKAASAARKPAL